MLILITGSRETKDEKTVYSYLDAMWEKYGDDLNLLHGGARSGVDNMVAKWAKERLFPKGRVWAFPPEYDKYPGRLAPKFRNRDMVDQQPDHVQGFWITADGGSGGTANCITWAVLRGIHCEVTELLF